MVGTDGQGKGFHERRPVTFSLLIALLGALLVQPFSDLLRSGAGHVFMGLLQGKVDAGYARAVSDVPTAASAKTLDYIRFAYVLFLCWITADNIADYLSDRKRGKLPAFRLAIVVFLVINILFSGMDRAFNSYSDYVSLCARREYNVRMLALSGLLQPAEQSSLEREWAGVASQHDFDALMKRIEADANTRGAKLPRTPD